MSLFPFLVYHRPQWTVYNACVSEGDLEVYSWFLYLSCGTVIQSRSIRVSGPTYLWSQSRSWDRGTQHWNGLSNVGDAVRWNMDRGTNVGSVFMFEIVFIVSIARWRLEASLLGAQKETCRLFVSLSWSKHDPPPFFGLALTTGQYGDSINTPSRRSIRSASA